MTGHPRKQGTSSPAFKYSSTAALSLRHSQSALGAYYRKMAQRLGGDIAVFATARKLATLIYRLLRWGQLYVDEGANAYETRYRQQRIGRLAATAKQLGYQLAPINASIA